MSETNKLIIVIGIMFSFVVNSIMFGWESTRRSADDKAKLLNRLVVDQKEVERKASECIVAGGLPNYYNDGSWEDCNKK